MQLRKERTGALPVAATTSRSTDGRRSRSATSESAPATLDWEYAPAPEARDIVSLAGALRPVHRRRVRSRRGRGDVVPDRSRPRPRSRSPRSRRRARRTSTLAVDAAREAFENGWSKLRRRERAKYIFRIARDPPGAGARARGRRVDRRRQADQGVARRRRPARRGALLLLRGLGRQARVRVPGPRPRPLGVAGADHPVELPAAHGSRGRSRRRSRAGNTVVLKPAETTPLTALLLRRDLPTRPSCRRAS